MNNYIKIYQTGFTIIELIVTIAIASILIAFAAPGFGNFIANQNTTTATNDLIRAMTVARSQAVKQKRHVTICPSTDATTCNAGAALNEWKDGWIIFANSNSGALVRDVNDPNEALMQVYSAPRGIENITLNNIVGAGGYLSYRPNGLIGNVVADPRRLFTICDERGAAHAKAIFIGRSGRAKQFRPGAEGTHPELNINALVCP